MMIIVEDQLGEIQQACRQCGVQMKQAMDEW